MGSVCSCLRVEDFEDYVNPNNSAYRNCSCLRCFVRNFLNAYTSIFRRGELPSSIQGSSSLNSSASFDNSLSDMFRSPPRPLPYDADQRYMRLQRDGLVSRRDKGSSLLLNEDSETRRSEIDIDIDTEPLRVADKLNGSNGEDESKDELRKSSFRFSTATSAVSVGKIYTFLEDEDVCPTCLEEYTQENPKIMTKCAHHFHLGCIYEWMERSESCPVCGQVMGFEETA